MDVTVWFDPETGEAERGDEQREPPPDQWKVIREGTAVSVLARNKKNKVVLHGNGTWTGKGIGKRYAVSDPISNGTWAKIENALHRLGRADAEPSAAPARPLVDTGPETVIPGARASVEATALPSKNSIARGARDSRSGWWALGAAALAAIGFVIAAKAMQPGDTVGVAITISLGVGTLGLLIYGGYGLGTRCPSCKSWYRRETTSTDNLGTSTTTRQESKPVTDSSGKQIGTTYETATYEVTHYRYHYRCKECAHRWTGSGSSERRIS